MNILLWLKLQEPHKQQNTSIHHWVLKLARGKRNGTLKNTNAIYIISNIKPKSNAHKKINAL